MKAIFFLLMGILAYWTVGIVTRSPAKKPGLSRRPVTPPQRST